MLRVLAPGSFDPPTNGHMDIISRAHRIFDEIHVVIAANAHKEYTFSSQERYNLLKELLQPFENVELHICEHLIVDFAQKIQAKIIVRGIRSFMDMGYEFDLSTINRSININNIETVFMPTNPQYLVTRSSSIKELVRLGGDVSNMVPPIVAQALKDKLCTS